MIIVYLANSGDTAHGVFITNHTTQRIWPKFNADLESGYQLTEARAKAAAYPSEVANRAA